MISVSIAILIYALIFPGPVKMLIGGGGILFNIAAFLLVCILLSRKKRNKIGLKYILTFVFAGGVLISWSIILLLFDVSKLGSFDFEYVVKLIVNLTLAAAIICFLSVRQISIIMNVIVFFSLLTCGMYYLGLISFDVETVNYLTITMPLAAAVPIILMKLDYHNKIQVLFLLSVLMISLYLTFTSGSRSALVMSAFFIVVMTSIKLYKQGTFGKLALVGFLSILAASIFKLLSYLEHFNPLVFARISRIFDSSYSNEVGQEVRTTIYGNVWNLILELKIFGHGINAGFHELNYKYVESFVLESLLNYGVIFGGVLLFFLVIYPSILFLNSKRTGLICCCYLLYLTNVGFYIKGWGFADASILFVCIALLIVSVREEFKELQ